MNTIPRRSFLQMATRITAVMGLGIAYVPGMTEALAQLAGGNAPVMWLQGQCCSGCSVSLLDSESLTPAKLLTRTINLVFHQTLSTATGHAAVEVVNKTIEQGGYILVVEGSVPAKMPNACLFGEETFNSQLVRAAKNATAILAVGTCAAFGGVPAAENNPTGAVSVPTYLKDQGIAKPTILIPGCPFHPDWFIGTVAHVLKFGLPPLDNLGRPKAFFSRHVHDQCPRFADYEREIFAKTFGEPGCLFNLGCQGPITKADCSLRAYNGGTNSCLLSGAPCIGCADKHFMESIQLPMLTKVRAANTKNI